MSSSVHRRLSPGSQLAQEEVRADEKHQCCMAVLLGEVSGAVSRAVENRGCSRCVVCHKLHWVPTSGPHIQREIPGVSPQCSVGSVGSGRTVPSSGVSASIVASAGYWGMPVRARRLWGSTGGTRVSDSTLSVSAVSS